MNGGSSTRALGVWFLLGVLQVLAFQALAVQGPGAGNWAWLLQVASEKPMRHRIEAELGEIPNQQALGHDGEMQYLIARDPLGREGVPALLLECDDPQYRYRRILFPLLAGGAGQFGPWLTLYSMSFWLAVGNGLAMVAVADLARCWGIERWAVLLAWINVGVLMSAGCMTMDTLALGLLLCAVGQWVRGRHGLSLACFALAALTKETSLLVPWALAVWSLTERRVGAAALLVVLPAVPVGGWTLWLMSSMPHGITETHFTLPFVGLARAFEIWSRDPAVRDVAWLLGLIGLGTIVTAATVGWLSSNRLLNWISVPWIVMGIVASEAIWGSNAVRVLMPLWPVMTLNLGWLLRTTDASPCPAHVTHVTEGSSNDDSD